MANENQDLLKTAKNHLFSCSSAVRGTGLFAATLFVMMSSLANAHDDDAATSVEACETSSSFGAVTIDNLEAPYSTEKSFQALLSSRLGKSVLKNLWVNSSKSAPCFAISDTPIWGAVVSRIPADVVGVEMANDESHALIYVSGVPDYTIETPNLFTSFKPGNIYGVYKLNAEPQADTNTEHEFATAGAVAFFVNGSSIFNYSDTFSYQDKGAWLYNANVAEATIVNSDVAHATPSNFPGFDASRGIFHNHQMSVKFLTQLQDPFVTGEMAHSKQVGFAIDGFAIYGPIGFTSKDESSGLGVLRSSYVKRSWMDDENGGSGHRSALPDWIVRGWNGEYTGETLRNSFEKNKADMLFSDGASEGAVTYSGDDEKLAAEIEFLASEHELKRDDQGYVYWEHEVTTPAGAKVTTRNYLLKSSDIWGPDVRQTILPVSYQAADLDKFLFQAEIGSFAEDYDYIQGYGDLDFYNGIESYVPEHGAAIYHYVSPYDADISDEDRLTKATFPYFIGIEYKGVVDPFNRASISENEKGAYLAENRDQYTAIMDLGVTGKDEDGNIEESSVFSTWIAELGAE